MGWIIMQRTISTTSVADNIGNGDMMGTNIDINVPNIDGDVKYVNKSKIEIVTTSTCMNM